MLSTTSPRLTQEIGRQSRLSRDIDRLQTQISTGIRVAKASDDPGAAARIADIGRSQSDSATWAGTIARGQMLTAEADRVLQSVNSLMARASELTVAGASETASAADRSTYATQLAGIADELDTLTRTTTVTGERLFSSGSALQMRFGKDVVFAPVASSADTFDIGGRSLAQLVRDAGTAIGTGNSAAIADIQTATSTMADRRAALGQRAARLDTLDEGLKQRSVTLAESRSALEDTDLSSAIAELNGKLTSLDAARAAFARINRQTLFDILR